METSGFPSVRDDFSFPNLSDWFLFLAELSCSQTVLVLSSPSLWGTPRHSSLGMKFPRVLSDTSYQMKVFPFENRAYTFFWNLLILLFGSFCDLLLPINIWCVHLKKNGFIFGWEWCSVLSWLVMLFVCFPSFGLLGYRVRRWNLYDCLSFFSPFGSGISCFRNPVLSSEAYRHRLVYLSDELPPLSWSYLLQHVSCVMYYISRSVLIIETCGWCCGDLFFLLISACMTCLCLFFFFFENRYVSFCFN